MEGSFDFILRAMGGGFKVNEWYDLIFVLKRLFLILWRDNVEG